MCDLIGKTGAEYEISLAFGGTWWFALLEYSSAFVSFLFFTIVYYNKELQVHPMKIIMYLALAEAGF